MQRGFAPPERFNPADPMNEPYHPPSTFPQPTAQFNGVNTDMIGKDIEIISSKIEDARDAIQEALKVPVEVLDFAESDLPGSCGIANNKGVIVHPLISEQEAEKIAKVMQVEIDVSTVNCGKPYVGGGMIVNDYGAIFGRETTGPEIQRVIEVLQLE